MTLGGVNAVDEAEDGLRRLLGGLHRGVVAGAVELDGTDPRRRAASPAKAEPRISVARVAWRVPLRCLPHCEAY